MHRPYITSHSSPKTPSFPQDISCIIHSSSSFRGSLFISNIQAAENVNTLKSKYRSIKEHKIGAILSTAKGHQLSHSRSVVPYYLYIPGIDHEGYDLSINFDKGVDFITEHLKITNVLVHCVAGVSRSVSMVIAYFIREQNMTFEQAYRRVKSQRSIIYPNDGFVKQLKLYAYQHNRSRSRGSSENRSVSSGRKLNKSANLPDREDKKIMGSSPKPKIKNDNYFNSNRYEYQYFAPGSASKQSAKASTVQTARPLSSHSKSMAKPKTYEEKQFFPVASTAKKQPKMKTEANTLTPTYFKSLNAELEDKINKIKNKYNIQRQQMVSKYAVSQERKPSRPASSTYYHHYNAYDYVPKYSHLLKTQASDSKNRDKIQSSHQPYLDSLFPREFYLDKERKEVFRPTQPKTESVARNVYEKRTNTQLTKADSAHSNKYDVGKFYNRTVTSNSPQLQRYLFS